MFQSNLVAGFLSQVLESIVLPAQVNLLFHRDDSTGQPMGGHADSSQATFFQEINLIGQGHDMGEFKRSRFFTARPLKFRDFVYKKREAGFVVLAVQPRPMPSPKGSLHWKVKEAGTRVGLETHALDKLAACGTRLVFQEKVILEQRKIKRNAKKCFVEMDEDGNLKNGVGIEID
jgi:hypothetical protein